jgi:hypothetical protein
MMKVVSDRFDKFVLSKFAKVSKLAQSYATDAPMWSSIFFDKKNQRILYVGWKFQMEVEYPVKEEFIVNFDRLRAAIKTCKKPTIRTTKHHVIVEEDSIKIKLKRLDLDYSNYIIPEPEGLIHEEVREGLINDIKFCSLTAAQDRMDYVKYGVILGNDMICGMDSKLAVSVIFLDKPLLAHPVLLHLPWCKILQDLGEIETIAYYDPEQQYAILFITTKDNFKLVVPALKVVPNPSIVPYLKTLEAHVTLRDINLKILKKLEITSDSAYKFITAFSKEGRIYLESSSKAKGKTVLDLCEGDMGDTSVTLSLQRLKDLVSINNYLNIDLDNMAAFITVRDYTEDYIFAFSLG